MKPTLSADGKEIFPTHANRIQAAQMVFERAQPAVKRVESVSASYCEVNLSQFEQKESDG